MTASVCNQTTSGMDLVSAFNKIDVDGSGRISNDEMWERIGGQGGVSREDFNVLFGVIDKDNSGNVDFAEYSLFMEQLQKLRDNGKRRRKSSMKVPTLDGSLSSCDRPELKKKKQSKSTRSIRLLSLRRQRSFKTNNLDLEKSNSKVTAARETTIRFFDVEVREYGISVSDNPGVKSGVALELGWEYNVLERDHLDTFEARRSKQRSENFMKEKKLTRLEREKILREFGATPSEIQDAAKRAATIRNGRKKSISMRQHDKLYEDVEKNVRSFKNFFHRRSKKKLARQSDVLDLERLHPTLMAMMGVDDAGDE